MLSFQKAQVRLIKALREALSFCHGSPERGIHCHFLVFVGMPDPMTARLRSVISHLG